MIDGSWFINLYSFKIRKNWIIIGLIACLSLISAYFSHRELNIARNHSDLAISLANPIVKPSHRAYNVAIAPKLRHSQQLQTIIDNIVAMARQQNLPTKKLSITLIDVNSRQVAGYREKDLRYPASISKLFWMVSAFDLIERKQLSNDASLKASLVKMIRDSDNDSASRILDLITDSQSGANLNRKELTIWLEKRHQIDRFFQNAGYDRINLAQKTYPIPYLHLELPQGRDLQLRGSLQHPLRNQISTWHSGRLMYEIATGMAVSPQSSRQMMALLTIDAVTRRSRIELPNSAHFNSVLGFLSQSLPDAVDFASKAGWTSDSRQEVARIKSKNGKINYIVSVCGENRDFADNWQFFPELSLYIFQKMNLRTLVK
jgi:hypothetical protein